MRYSIHWDVEHLVLLEAEMVPLGSPPLCTASSSNTQRLKGARRAQRIASGNHQKCRLHRKLVDGTSRLTRWRLKGRSQPGRRAAAWPALPGRRQGVRHGSSRVGLNCTHNRSGNLLSWNMCPQGRSWVSTAHLSFGREHTFCRSHFD